MTILGVDSKCYILALFIRSDGERFLLGSGYYEFKDSQQHFAANTIANDVIEVQGNDGYMLGGQVRRPGVQSFDGYVGDGTTSKTEVEEYRRDFLSFFRKNFMYKVVYVFPDGSAIQRKRGFLVDAPTVQELYQIYPEYHVALNFEDINYYFYDEDADGDEIYGKSAVLGLTVAASGGLIWDNLGAVSLPYSWTDPVEFSGSEVTITNNLNVQAPITDLQLKGDTYQQTYSGKNLSTNINTYTYGLNGNASASISGSTLSITTGVSGAGVYFTRSANATNHPECYTAGNVVSFTVSSNVTGKISVGFEGGGQVFFDTSSTPTRCSFLTQSTGNWVIYQSGNYSNVTYEISEFQIEAGSTATPYEPYVGGTASPSPDYPQNIQTVTGEQSVWVHGKNLFNPALLTQASGYNTYNSSTNLWTTNTGGNYFRSIFYNVTGNNTTRDINKLIHLQANKTYTIKFYDFQNNTSQEPPLDYALFDNFGEKISNTRAGNFYTFTTPNQECYLDIRREQNSGSVSFSKIMLVEGTYTEQTFPSYEPTQSYTIDLGSTELCKIGDYQDYIYKSGDDWYVHKETGKIVLAGGSDETWGRASVTGGKYRFFVDVSGIQTTSDTSKVGLVISDKLVEETNESQFAGNQGIRVRSNDSEQLILYINATSTMDVDSFKTWLASNNITAYYALSTPTNTKITDEALIGQLEALGSMKLFVGENNILVAATTPNLPAILEASYFTGIDFSGAGYEWEPGEAGGTKIITVDSIDNVYPLLTVTGPATNPAVTNITTGTIFRYNGTVTSSQVLKVDMMNKTATLNGTSVIGNVSGDWLYFQPGDNRVDYSTNNADAPNALIEWQEIVG